MYKCEWDKKNGRSYREDVYGLFSPWSFFNEFYFHVQLISSGNTINK